MSNARLAFAEPNIWFGAPLFLSNYVKFNYKAKTIQIAPKYIISFTPLRLQEFKRCAFLIAGAFIFFVALVTLISNLKKIEMPPQPALKIKPVIQNSAQLNRLDTTVFYPIHNEIVFNKIPIHQYAA